MEDISIIPRAIVAVFVGGLIIGGIVLAWIFILGPAFNQASYQQFNNSPQHLNAVAQKFSDDCLQLAEAKDATSRKAIEQDIYLNASTVNVNQVDMPDTTRQCVERAIFDATHQ